MVQLLSQVPKYQRKYAPCGEQWVSSFLDVFGQETLSFILPSSKFLPEQVSNMMRRADGGDQAG